MSTMHPTGDGRAGLALAAPTDDNMTPAIPLTGMTVPSESHHRQHPPPSPLSGCYLLVVLPEPHTAQHKDLILNRLAKGFLSWDKNSCHVDLEKELQALVTQAPEGEVARNGERLIQYATENLVTEVLIHPQANTLLQCIRNLLASFTKHRHIIHAGYTFKGNGSWILQDGTFSLADFLDAFGEHEVQRVLRAYENSVTVDINCIGVGEWSTARLSKEACTRSCRVRLNPDDVLTAGVPAITSFTSYVGQYLVSQTLDQLMEPSDVVGNIRFSHPTLYVFPGGQGDAALFGINGFNMLIDGGFARKACFWDFARHLDRLDAVLITRINNSNVGGMSSILRKKRQMPVYPQIGHFFCNLIERRHSNSPDGDKDLDPLILNLTDIGQEMMVDLRQINLRAHPCYRDPNPINLYHKVGHGTLDMYVLSPSKDSLEVREFLTKWHASDSKLFTGSYRKDLNNLTFPIQNLASICALLVWQPANPEDTITRILFPGSTPQHKIFEGIERLKHLEFLKHPVCSAKSLSPPTSILALKDRSTAKQKLGLIEETKKSSAIKKDTRDLSESKLPKTAEELGSKITSQAAPIITIPKAQPARIDVKSKKAMDNRKMETESKKIEKDLKESKKESMKKDVPKIEMDSEIRKLDGYRIKIENEKMTLTKDAKVKSELKKKDVKEFKPVKVNKAEPLPKPSAKIPDKKPKPLTEKKDTAKACPPTPKKNISGSATRVELARTISRPITKPASKQPSSTMPAKSAKDANNRKVVEQKNIEIASAASASVLAISKPPAKQRAAERKPIGRRTKPVSPKKARIPLLSPTKSTRSTPTTSAKSDKDGVIRKVKGGRETTDSSTVSTPSGIEIDLKLADKSLFEKSEDMSLDSIESKVLADLKEEREVVEEIEAVLQKAERVEGARGEDHLDGDDDVTAEATDKKEEDMTEDDITADIEELPKKEISRKTSHELTEEDEYLIIEKEEIYIEDSIQSGEGEPKNLQDVAESEITKTLIDADTANEKEKDGEESEAEFSEGKEKTDIPEKQLDLQEGNLKEIDLDKISTGHEELLKVEMKHIITSSAELIQKAEPKDDSGKKDSADITKEPSSGSPDRYEPSEKKTADTNIKSGLDQKDPQVLETLDESHERISTLESGATTTAPTLPEDERIPLDEIKEVIDEKYTTDQDQDENHAAQSEGPSIAHIPVEPTPDVKPFGTRLPLHGIQREIVKTPDEVADLPVHEEVDPKLYQIEDFENVKEERTREVTMQQQQTTELETPLVKEQKGVFSFFGKVADKFEKGIDKLTGKSRRDFEKDIDEKSTSKSGSPKEVKSHYNLFLDDIGMEQISPAATKAEQMFGVHEPFGDGEPEIGKVKVAAIKDTVTFLQDNIGDLHKIKNSSNEWKERENPLNAFSHESESHARTKTVGILDPVFGENILKDDETQMDSTTRELGVEEDVGEVEALLEEASKKFKTVKDSLRDSLESLDEKIVEEEAAYVESEAVFKDVVKDTLSEVVEKLEDIKPRDEGTTQETKKREKVKFDDSQTEEVMIESQKDMSVLMNDFKGAVRDVGEVLAGSAGISIEDKPKDVIDIVKKVAEVLKKDDFLSRDVLFDEDAAKVEDKTTENEAILERLMIDQMALPKKVGTTEEVLPLEEIEGILESRISPSLLSYEIPEDLKILKDTFVEIIETKSPAITSPVSDLAMDTVESIGIRGDLMQDASVSSRQKPSAYGDQMKLDVMEAGIEATCIKQNFEDPLSGEAIEHHDMDDLKIVLDRKVSPVTAEAVTIVPDFSPTSPTSSKDELHIKNVQTSQENPDVSVELPSDLQNALHSDEPLSTIIEDFVFTGKNKMTPKIMEYITVIRKIPRQKVICIIEELIIKKGASRESIVANLDLSQSDEDSVQKRGEIEDYIHEQYVMKQKKITKNSLEQISFEKLFNISRVVEIIEDIIIKKKIPREMILDISEKEFSELDSYCKDNAAGQDEVVKTFEISGAEDSHTRDTISPTAAQHSEIENWIIDEIITAGKKMTPKDIDDICMKNVIPKCTFVKIMEALINKRNIPRSTVLDISENELSELLASEEEHYNLGEVNCEPEQRKYYTDETGSIMTEKWLEIAKYVSDEFIMKKRKITPQIFVDISLQNNVSRQKLTELIEGIVAEHKIRRSSFFDVSDNELAELLAVEDEEIEKVRTATTADEELLVVDSDTIESASPERSEIENTIVEGFILKNKRITPYIFEDICVRYKVPRRIIIEIIEEIIVKRNIKRNTILDITDTELSELLTMAETEGEEEQENNVSSIVQEDFVYDDAVDGKLDDGFISRQSKAEVSTKTIHVIESVADPPTRSENDVVDDFEAVEQEYKIRGVSIKPDKGLLVNVDIAIPDEEVNRDIKEAIGDDVSEVFEATEKVSEIVPMVVATINTERKSEDLNSALEIADSTEKHLIENQKKTVMEPHEPVPALDNIDNTRERSNLTRNNHVSEVSVEVPPAILKLGYLKYSELINNYPQIEENLVIKESTEDRKIETNFGETKVVAVEVIQVPEKTIEPEMMETGIDICVRGPVIIELNEEHRESVEQDSKHHSPITMGTIDLSREGRDSHELTEQAKDSITIKVLDEVEMKTQQSSPEYNDLLNDISIRDESVLPSGTVCRMVVITDSEGGRQETEVCSTRSITVTPDDSLKSSPIKTTSDQDSLKLEKESLNSGISTPEKDSISDKSTTGTKDGNKITPEDSLEKSLLGTRDSQGLEDSLKESDPTKLNEIETEIPVIKDLEDTIVSSMNLQPQISSPQLFSAEPKLSRKSIVESEMLEIAADKLINENQSPDETMLSSSVVDDEKKIAKASQRSQSDEYDLNDQHDHGESLSIYYDKIAGVGRDLQPISPRSTGHDVENARKMVESPGAEGVGSLASKSPISQVRTTIEKYEFDDSDIRDEIEHLEICKSPTITGGKDEDKRWLNPSGTSSRVTEKDDQAELIDCSRAYAAEKHNETDWNDAQPLSDAAENQDGTKWIDDAKAISTATEKKGGKKSFDQLELASFDNANQQETNSGERARSPHMSAEEHDVKETLTHSRSSSFILEKPDGKDAVDRSQSPSIYYEECDEKLSTDDSKSPGMPVDQQHKNEPIGRSRLSNIAAMKEDGNDLLDYSRSSTISNDVQNEKELTSGFRSPSSAAQKEVDIVPIDQPRTPSIADEKCHGIELIEYPRDGSIGTEKLDEEKPAECSRLPRIIAKADDENQAVDGSKTSCIVAEHQDKQILADNYSSSSITTENQDIMISVIYPRSLTTTAEKTERTLPIKRARPTSIEANEQGEMESFDHSKSPSIAVKKQDKPTVIDYPRSPSIVADNQNKKGWIDRSQSCSTDAENQNENEPFDISTSLGISNEKNHEAKYIEGSRPTSISGEELKDKETDHSKSRRVADEQQETKDMMDRSRASSVVADMENETGLIHHPRSPSISAEIQDRKDPIDGSTSSSIVADKENGKEPVDHLKSLSIATEKHVDEEAIDRSRSPSITADKQGEEESINDRRSHSVAAEKPDKKEITDRSRSPSVVAAEQNEKETIDRSQPPTAATENQHNKKPINSPRSFSITDKEQHEVEHIEFSGLPGFSDKKRNDGESAGRSRSPSVPAEQQDESGTIDSSTSSSDVIDKQKKKEIIEHSGSPSITAENQDGNKTIDGPRPLSIPPEKQDGQEPIDQAPASRVTADKQDEEDSIDQSRPLNIPEKQDEQKSSGRSRSPSVVADQQSGKEPIDHSPSTIIATENQDKKKPVDSPRSFSITDKEQHEVEHIERSGLPTSSHKKWNDTEPADRSRSPSVPTEQQDESGTIDCLTSSRDVIDKQNQKETIEHFGPPSIAAENEDENEMIDGPRPLSIPPEKQDGQEPINQAPASRVTDDKQDEEESIDQSRPLNIREKQDIKKSSGRSRSPSVVAEQQNGKEPIDHSPSTIIATENQDGKKTVDSPRSFSITDKEQHEVKHIERSGLPSFSDKKWNDAEPVDRSRSPSVPAEQQDKSGIIDSSTSSIDVIDKQNKKETIEDSGSPSITAENQDGNETIEGPKPLSIPPEKQDGQEPIDHAPASRVTADKQDEEESIDQSRPLNIPEKQDEEKSSCRSRSPSVVADQQNGKEAIDHSQSSIIATENQDEKKPIDSPRSFSITDKEQHKGEDTEPSGLPSFSDKKWNDAEPVDRSRSPSVPAEQQDKSGTIDSSTSSSDVIEKQNKKETIEHSGSPSITAENQDGNETIDGPKPLIIPPEKQDGQEPIDLAPASRVTADKQDEEESIDQSRPLNIPEKQDEEKSSGRSRSPSVVADQQNGKEAIDHSQSSIIATENQDEKKPIDSPRSFSIADKEQHKGEDTEPSGLPSFSDKKWNDAEPADRSRSPSVPAEQQDESGTIDSSTSSSDVIEKQNEKETIEHSGSPSITAENQDGIEMIDGPKPLIIPPEKQDGQEPIDLAPASRVTADKQDEEETIDQSRPLNIPEKQDEEKSSGRSRSPSVVADQQNGKEAIDHSQSSIIATENQDEKKPIDSPRSFSIADKEQHKGEDTEPSGLPSFSDKKWNDAEPADRSRSPSVPAEQQDESGTIDSSTSSSDVIEKQNEKETIEHSGSPSITAENQDGIETIDGPKPLIIPPEKQDGQEPIDLAPASRVTADKQDEEESIDQSRPLNIPEKQDEEKSSGRSRSPSVVADQQNGKEAIDHSQSSIIATENQDEKKPIDSPRSFSIADKEQHKGEDTEPSGLPSFSDKKWNDAEPADRSRSPSVPAEQQDESGTIDSSTSSSDVIEKQNEKETIEHSGSPSITAENQDGIETIDGPKPLIIPPEKQDGQEPIDLAPASRVTADKQDEEESIDQSRPLNIPEKQDDEKSSGRSRSPSVVADQQEPIDHSQSTIIATENQDEKKPIDGSRSFSIADAKQCEEEQTEISRLSNKKWNHEEPANRSKSPSVLAEQQDEEEVIDNPSSPTVATDKQNEKKTIEHSASSNIIAENQDGDKAIDGPRPLSIAVMQQGGHEPIGRPHLSSITADKLDEKKSIDQFRSLSITAKQDEKEAIAHFKSPNIPGKILAEKEANDCSMSPSITADKQSEEESINDPMSPSVAAEKQDEQEITDHSRSPSVSADNQDGNEPNNRSRSPSASADNQDGNEPNNRSRSPSNAADKPGGEELIDRSCFFSITADKQDEEKPIDQSKSLNITDKQHVKERITYFRSSARPGEKIAENEVIDQSRLCSITADMQSEGGLFDHLRPSGAAAKKQGGQEPIGHTQSSSIAVLKDNEGKTVDQPRSFGMAKKGNEKKAISHFTSSVIPDEKLVENETMDQLRSSRITPDKQGGEELVGHPSSLSVSAEKQDEKETTGRSMSPSIAADAQNEQESIKYTWSPSIAVVSQCGKELIDGSRVTSIPPEKQDGKEPVDHPRTSSVVAEKLGDEEVNNDSRPFTIAVDKMNETDSIDHSRSPSIASEKQDEMVPINRSRSPSATAEELHKTEPSTAPRSHSIAPNIEAEQQDGEELIDQFVAPIITAGEESVNRSRSSSIAAEKCDEVESDSPSTFTSIDAADSGKTEEEKKINSAKSPRTDGETLDEKEPDDWSRTSNIGSEELNTKVDIDFSVIGMQPSDKKEPISSLRSPPIAGEKLEEEEPTCRPRSSNMAMRNQGEKEPITGSRTSSVSVQYQDEIETENHFKSSRVDIGSTNEKNLNARSISPDIRLSESANALREIEMLFISSKKSDEPGKSDTSESPGTEKKETSKAKPGDTSRKDCVSSEEVEEIEPIDPLSGQSCADSMAGKPKYEDQCQGPRSPQILDEKHDGHRFSDHSGSLGVPADMDTSVDKTQPIDMSKLLHDQFGLPGIHSGKIDDKTLDNEPGELSENDDVSRSDLTKLPCITGDEHSEHDTRTSAELSRPPSAASKNLIEKISLDSSRCPSIEGGKHVNKDEKSTECELPRITGEKHDEPIDLSKSTAIVNDKLSDEDKSRTAFIASARVIDEQIDTQSFVPKDSAPNSSSVHDSILDQRGVVKALQKLSDTIVDKSLETKCDSTVLDGIAQQNTPADRSRSHSLFDADEKTPLDRSRTASLFEGTVTEVATTFQRRADYIHNKCDEATIATEDVALKASMKYMPEDQIAFASDSKELSVSKFEDTIPYRSYAAIEGDMGGLFAEDYHTMADRIARINEYIEHRYIMKKEKITSRIVDEIVTLHSMPRTIVLKLIEAIIAEKEMPRDSMVNFSSGDEPSISAVVFKGDQVNVMGILPAERLDIETYIHEELLANRKKISWKEIDELAASKSIPRYIIVMIIKEMIIEKKLLRAELIEDGILDESRAEIVQLALREGKGAETEGIMSHQSTLMDEGRIEEVNLPSISRNHNLKPDSVIEAGSTISDQKRVEIETYIMEECVKKGRKITVLVLEQIIAKITVPKSVLLDIIENIIVTRKMSRMGMVDDAIYDDIDLAIRKAPEYIPIKDRVVEFSGKSTPDFKLSGYSTLQARQYADTFGKEMSSYATDFESPFHKAFVGGMTEIRTTHITTFSGKSTPDYCVRSKTPESLPHNIMSSNHEELDGTFIGDKCLPHTSGHIATEPLDPVTSIFSPEVTMATATIKVPTTTDSMIVHIGLPLPSDTGISCKILGDDHSRMVKQDITKSQIDHQLSNISSMANITSLEVYNEEQPELTTKTIRREVSAREQSVFERKAIQKEIVEEQPEIGNNYDLCTISQSNESRSPEFIQTITAKATESILTEGLPHHDDSKIQGLPEMIVPTSGSMGVPKNCLAKELVSRNIGGTITTATTLTDFGEQFIAPKNTQKITSGNEAGILETLVDDSSTTTAVINKVAITEPIDNLETKQIITEDINTITLALSTSTPAIHTVCDSEMSIAHTGSRDKQPEDLGKTHRDKIIHEKLEHPISSIINDHISDKRSYSGKSFVNTSLSPDVQAGDVEVKLTSDISSLARDSSTGHPHTPGRTTPDKRPTSRSSTATPESLRSNEVIKTTITTTRTMSEEGDIITTTMEITETTNEKGETTVLEEKTDVKVEDRILPTDIGKVTVTSGIGSMKVPTNLQSEIDADPVSPRSDHSSLHSRASTHVWGGSDERHVYSDEEAPVSPLSTTSQVGYSPQSTHHFGEHSFTKGSSHKSVEFSEANMSSSFCSELPDLSHRVANLKTADLESNYTQAAIISGSKPMDSDFTFKKFSVEKDPASESTDEGFDSKKYVDDAHTDFEKVLTEREGITGDKTLSSAATTGRPNDNSLSSSLVEEDEGSRVDAEKDILAGWGTPLGLPSPKPPKKFNLRIMTRSNNLTTISPDLTNIDAVNDWGEPHRLPSPTVMADEASNKAAPSTPKKERKQPKKVIAENIKNGRRSESPSKNEKKSKDLKSKINPVYMDLTYVPHHGNSYYTSVEFFKRIRARYYVFSGTEPSREVYDALLDAKKTWEDKDLEVTMISTYDTDTLGYWVADNEEALAANHIDLSPSASRCTINLQDHETSCSAYRLEF